MDGIQPPSKIVLVVLAVPFVSFVALALFLNWGR